MKANFQLTVIITLFTLLGCKKAGDGNNTTDIIPTLPLLTSSVVDSITSSTAIGGGNITSDGGSSITARGVCWNTSQFPTIANNKTSDGTGTGSFTSAIAGLTDGTTYYVRAYATNIAGTTYGNEFTFSASANLPSLTTNSITSITSTTAVSGGNITSDGGGTVSVRGVCWNISTNPTTANSKTTDGSASGSFTSSITGLTANTTYYVRAYATNSAGTAYGNQQTFTTSNTVSTGTVTDIDGNVYKTVTIGTQTWMVENLRTTKYNDNTAIPNVTDATAWSILTTPGMCTYNNTTNADTINTYGRLYNWYTVSTGKLAPTGWHVPTDAEWTTLENYLITNGYNYDGTTTGNKYAKALASATGWNSYTDIGAVGNTDYPAKRNATGFTALPGGYRSNDGTFDHIDIGYWWSSSEYNTNYAWRRYLSYGSFGVARYYYEKSCGFSVRCVKD